jgi:hypothetical protein
MVDVWEGSMEGRHCVTTCTLTGNNQEIPIQSPSDCGTTGIAFMDQDVVCDNQIRVYELKEKEQVKVINGRPIDSGDITHNANLGIKVQDHGEQVRIFITMLGHYRIVPGIPCLPLYDVPVRFVSNPVTFGSQYCITCTHNASVTVHGVTEEPPESVYDANEIFEWQIQPPTACLGNIVMVNGASFLCTVKQRKFTLFKAACYNINKAMNAKDE